MTNQDTGSSPILFGEPGASFDELMLLRDIKEAVDITVIGVYYTVMVSIDLHIICWDAAWLKLTLVFTLLEENTVMVVHFLIGHICIYF